ncbi:hypothetical protein [Phormidesmis sp. 146-33]
MREEEGGERREERGGKREERGGKREEGGGRREEGGVVVEVFEGGEGLGGMVLFIGE